MIRLWGEMPLCFAFLFLWSACGRIGYDFDLFPSGKTPHDSGVDVSLSQDANATPVDASLDGSVASRLCTVWSSFGVATQVAGLNSSGTDIVASISSDGLTLYMASNALPMANGFDIFFATRSNLSGDFAIPALFRGVGEAGDQSDGHVLGDDLSIYYTSFARVFLSTRASPSSAWGAGAPVSELNAIGTRSVVGVLSQDALEIFFRNDSGALGGLSDNDIWRATRASTQAPFDPPVKDMSLSTVFEDVPHVLFDNDLTLYFSSTRPSGQGSYDIWAATRSAIGQPWTNFALLTELNSSFSELSFVLTPDGRTAYFSSDRGMPGQHDIWKATRTCVVP